MRTKILTDTTCDLSKERREALDITALPLHVMLGGVDHLDGVDVTQEQLFAYAQENKQLPKTAAISVAEFQAAFLEAFEAGYDEVVYTGLSSKLSSTFQNALLARDGLGEAGYDPARVHIVDSKQLSSGTAHLLLRGAEILRQGGSAQEEAGQSGSGSTAAGKSGNQEKGAARITVAGDLCLAEDGFVLDHYDEVNDLEKCISPEILDITQSADVFFLNHEYAISDRGEPLEGKYYTFRAKPERMKLLEQMGTDLVSLANNHVYDYGPEAMLDTTDLLDEAGIAYVGGGRNIDEAERPAYFIVNGMKIGFVAASNAEKTKYTPAATEDSPGILEAYDTTEFNRVISQASEECDYLIAYIHWGPEDETQHTEEQTEEGTGFLESGADIVVGGHPHVLEGIGYIDGKPIVYSMGDFWFHDETTYTGLLNLDITYDGLKEMSFTPCLQTDYTTQYISDESEQREMFDYLEGLSDGVKIDDGGVITEASGGK